MTALTPIRTKAETALIAQFEALRAELLESGNGKSAKGRSADSKSAKGKSAKAKSGKGKSDPGTASREAAMATFAARGLPHRRIEAYHYTDLRNLLREAAPLAQLPSGKAGRSVEAGRFLGELGAHEIIIVNGVLMDAADLASQLPNGVSVAATSDTTPAILDRDDAVVALNTALSRETVTIRIEKGVKLERPLHICFVQDAGAPQAVHARLKVLVGEGASVTLLETHEGPNGIATQSNVGVEITAGDSSNVEHVRVNAEGDQAFALSSLGLSLGRAASALSLNLILGSFVSRHQILARFAGEGARLKLNGVGMLDGDRHADVTLVVDHAVPGGESRELFKTAVDQRANGVFQGKIIVRPHAQKTDGKMMSAALLLSEDASMSNKPELEIFADDVQCGHGATCGALDDNLLFYLMARGIPRREAQALLIRSFLGEATEELSNEVLRDLLGGLIDGWLMRRVEA